MDHLQMRLRASQHAMYGSGKTVLEPKLIIGYTPKLLVDPFLSNLGYSTLKKSIAQNINVDVNLILDYSQNKKKHLKNPKPCLAEASFEHLDVNTPYPNNHYLVGYVQYHQKRLNEILWPLDIDLEECLRKTGYDRKNGNRPADLLSMVPFLVLRVHERWHIYDNDFVINREYPVSLLRDGYAVSGNEDQAMYHKVQRHWELSDGFERHALMSSDKKLELISQYKTFDKTLPALLLANFDGTLSKYPVADDLTNGDSNDHLHCGLDKPLLYSDFRLGHAIYFPKEQCVYYDSELLSLNNQYGHLARQSAIVPQTFAWLVKTDWKPVSGK
jgi:hypothetical protein